MNRCTFCGREANMKTKTVDGYTILECCTDCEVEIAEDDFVEITPEDVAEWEGWI